MLQKLKISQKYSHFSRDLTLLFSNPSQMVQLNTLLLATIGLAIPAVAQKNYCASKDGTPWARSSTGFRFTSTSSSTWQWSSVDYNTDLVVYQDCNVVQHRPGSQRALRQFCIATSNNYQCWEAPGLNDPSGSCYLPDCSNINNMWAWFDG